MGLSSQQLYEISSRKKQEHPNEMSIENIIKLLE